MKIIKRHILLFCLICACMYEQTSVIEVKAVDAETNAAEVINENNDTNTNKKTDNKQTDNKQIDDKKTDKKKTDKNKVIAITISAAGDCTLGVDSRLNSTFNDVYNKEGAAYFLKKVKPVFSKDDITIVNLEGTFTDSSQRANKKFTFKGPAKHVKILKKGSVEVVNLANNHTLDFGQQGFADTKKTLKDNKVKYCYNSTIAYQKAKGVKVAFIGFSQLAGVSEIQVKNAIGEAKKNKAKIIIISFHWGVEGDYQPSGNQKSIARYAINEGADLVLGHHPHVIQGVEKYKGRYIVYSLGNFCFGGNVNPQDKDSMIFQQTFYIKNGKLTKKNDARIIPCSLSGKSYTNDFQPVVLKGDSKKRLISKLKKLSNNMNVSIDKNGTLK